MYFLIGTNSREVGHGFLGAKEKPIDSFEGVHAMKEDKKLVRSKRMGQHQTMNNHKLDVNPKNHSKVFPVHVKDKNNNLKISKKSLMHRYK